MQRLAKLGIFTLLLLRGAVGGLVVWLPGCWLMEEVENERTAREAEGLRRPPLSPLVPGGVHC